MLHSVRKKFLTIVSPHSFVRVAPATTAPSVRFAYGDDFKIPMYPGASSDTTPKTATETTSGGNEPASPSQQEPRKPHRTQNGAMSLLWYAIIAIGIALIVRFFIAAPYLVEGASMDPSFESYHYLVIDRVSYRVANPSVVT